MKLRKLLAAALSLTLMCGAATTAATTAMAASLSAGTPGFSAVRQDDEATYVGRWVAKTISSNGNVSDYDQMVFYFDFKSGGTGSVTVYEPGEEPESSPVTWTADGNKVTIVEHYNGSDLPYTAYLSDNMLSITSDSKTVYFSKDDSGNTDVIDPKEPTEPETYEDGFFTFEIYSGYAVFTSCSTAAEGEITVPSDVKGVPVTSVGSDAFRFCKKVTAVNIPDSVTEMGTSLFTYCHALEKATVSEANPNFCSVGGVIFSKDRKTLVAFPPAYVQKDYVIPDGVETIREDAFYTAEIESLTMPDSVIKLDSFSFSYIKYMNSIKFSNNLETIGSYSFSNCIALESADIPVSVTSIGRNAFTDCKALAKITINNPECTIGESQNTLGSNDVTVIRGYADSTAHAYAEEYAFQFEDMDGNVLVTSTTATTTGGSETTTTTAVSTTASGTTTASTDNVQSTTAASTTTTKAPASTTTTVVSTTETAPVTTTTAPSLDSRFIGKWQLTGFTDNNGQPSDEYNGVAVYAIFNADGTGTMESYSAGEEPDIQNITWSSEGDKVTALITFEEGEAVLEFNYADNELTYLGSDGTLRFAKVVPAVVLGDANSDGSIDAKDASFILAAYSKASTGGDDGLTDEQKAAADVNTDGMVDAKDASAILAYYSYLSTGGDKSLIDFLA